MDSPECLPAISTSMEDVLVGQCLRYAGVYPVDDTSDHEIDTVVANCSDMLCDRESKDIDTSNENNDKKLELDMQNEGNVMSSDNNNCHCSMSKHTGRHRFHPQSPNDSYFAEHEWFREKAINYGIKDNCCSKRSISFQNFKGKYYMTCFHSAIYHG